MNDNTDGALVAGQRVSGHHTLNIRMIYSSPWAADKICADAAPPAIGSGALYA